MKDEKSISRRHFIQRISLLGVAGVGAGALLSACGGGGGEQAADTGAATEGGAETQADAAFSCTDTAGLTEGEVQTRQNLKYVDQTPEAGKLCNNCQFWQPDAPIEGPCGGCQIVKGPIHPEGYCTSWVAKQA